MAKVQGKQTVQVVQSDGGDSPSGQIVREAATGDIVTDSRGRRLVIRALSPLESIRFVRYMGSDSSNQTFMQMAMAAAMVRAIDDHQFSAIPSSILQVESRFDLIGDEGLTAILDLAKQKAQEQESEVDAKN